VLRPCATSRTVPGLNLGGVGCRDFSRGYRQNHVPWSQPSLHKWVPGISPGVKAAGAGGWWPTTLVVPNVKYYRALTFLPRPLRPSRRPVVGDLYLYLFTHYTVAVLHVCIFVLDSSVVVTEKEMAGWKILLVLAKCTLLGCYAVSTGNLLPTFRDNLSVPSSRWDR
jgi:hypothetical protein